MALMLQYYYYDGGGNVYEPTRKEEGYIAKRKLGSIAPDWSFSRNVSGIGNLI